MSERAGAEQRNLPTLTALRGLAALAVFFFHAGRELGWHPVEVASRQGYVGVGFFFVLSGFVLTWSARPGERPGMIYWRRFTRIYPIYLATLLAIAAYLLVIGRLNVPAFLLALTLTQAWTASQALAFGVNGPAWSLSAEAAFYAAFPFLLPWLAADERRARRCVAGWLLGALAVSYLVGLGPGDVPLIALVNPLIRGSEFALGIVTALAVQRGWRPSRPAWRPALGLAVVLMVLRFLRVPSPLPDTLVSPLFALVIAGAASADLRGFQNWLRHGWLVYAGEVSYAFYLVHEFLIGRVSGHFSAPLATVVSLALSILVAVVLHHAVEIPVRLWLASRRRGSGSADADYPAEHVELPVVGGVGDDLKPDETAGRV